MKKYGKYENKPEGVAAKQPKVKTALLQTYLTSLLCMVLCVTMFFGTSYAWFTSEVTNEGNEIYVGTLKVGLYKKNGATERVSLSGETASKLFDGNIRWEPGYTTLETIEIVNEGDLAFKYTLNFTDGAMADGGDLAAVAKCFDVWVFNHYNKTYTAPTSYGDINEANDWTYVGTLEEVLAGKAVLEDKNMLTVRDTDASTPTNPGTTDGVATTDTYTIALHMKKETSDASLMGKKITLNVKLVAYQMSKEQDAFGNGEYDDHITPVTNAEQLKNELNAGGEVLLLSDIEIKSESNRVTMSNGVLDGNGKTLTYRGGRGEGSSSLGVVTTSGGTIRNLTVVGGDDGRALYVTNLTSDLYVSDSAFSGAYAFNLNSANNTTYSLYFTNTVFKDWTSCANVTEHAYFTDCEFEKVLKPYGDTTLTNCKFTTEGLNIYGLEGGETISLKKCNYNGVKVSVNIVKAEDGTLTLEGDTDLVDIIVKDGDPTETWLVLKSANS